MITPAFDLSQDPEYLILNIRVPYTRTSEFDLYIDGTDFKFYAKPYFLRLTLPGRIVEDGREKAKFDIDKVCGSWIGLYSHLKTHKSTTLRRGQSYLTRVAADDDDESDSLFSIKVPKETAGEHFEGLQMLTSLLTPKGSRSAKPLVEDLSTGCGESAGDEDEDEDEDEEEFDWQVEQEVYKESSEEELRALQKYGFGNQRSGVFAKLQEELSDVTDVKNPDGMTAAERRLARLEAEASAFSPDHYLADFFEDDEIKVLLKFRPWWEKLSPSPEQEGETAVSFSDDEKEQLRKFTNRSYLLDKTSRYQVWLGLVDILLAYSYEVRSTEGEHNVESPWTIRKLSGTLCWLETYSNLQDVLVSFGRRVLCYPLYRHFGMVSAAVRDTTKILQSGKACVLKCLLDIHKVFRENDPAYILNDLYITDYCIWIQRVKSKKMTALASTLQKASLRKKDLELELEELEEAATMVAEEEEEKQGASKIAPMSRGDSSSASSDSNSSSSDSSDESEESEAEEQGCTDSNKGGAGGGGGGGEISKDNPLQPQPSSAASPIPQEPTSTLFSAEGRVNALPSASEGSRQLIQELGVCVAEQLKISQDSSYKAERSCSQPHSAGAKTEVTSGRSSSGTLLEPSPHKNPLLIVQTQDDLNDFIC